MNIKSSNMSSSYLVTFFNLVEIAGLKQSSLRKLIDDKNIAIVKREKDVDWFDIRDFKFISKVSELLSVGIADYFDFKPSRTYCSVELFAGCGGMALGLEKAGFKHVLLNEMDSSACKTLRVNRPEWNLVEGDVSNLSFSSCAGLNIDLLAGGFPCQAFSYAGKSLGFADTRGTLFFQFSRAINEIKPKVFLAENVRGLTTHDNGRTLKTIKETFTGLGYTLIECEIYKAMHYNVPQKRERLIIIGVRNDLVKNVNFNRAPLRWYIPSVGDAIWGEEFGGIILDNTGMKYSESKRKILSLVPEGGYWVDLPLSIQKQYMGKSFYDGGGKTGIARRLHSMKPSLTLTCSPAQKQTERCHPFEDRPLNIREYARIQTFPDDWVFKGSVGSQYKQIGNAVPVNLAYAIGVSILKMLENLKV